MAGVIDLFLIYSFIRRLATPFKEWEAYNLGIIDEKGELLKKRKELRTVKERDAFGLFDLLVLKLKKLLEKLPGGDTRIGSYAAALWLIKEHEQYLDRADTLTEEELFESMSPYMLIEGAPAIDPITKRPAGSWVIVDKSTGKAAREVFTKAVADKVNTDKYDVLPAGEYLAKFNKSIKEDAPANSAGGGAIAGIGVGPDGEPPMGKEAQKKYVKKAKDKILKRFKDPLETDLGD